MFLLILFQVPEPRGVPILLLFFFKTQGYLEVYAVPLSQG